MRFGMNLLLWTSDPTDELMPVIEKLKQMGYDGVEVPIFDLNPKKFETWGKRFDDLGLARTAVTVRSADDNPISPEAKVRAAAVEANKRVLDCCQAAGCASISTMKMACVRISSVTSLSRSCSIRR